ncbi:MAG: hypothetical protein V8S93_05860 [Lachnospiraceae bacterium]
MRRCIFPVFTESGLFFVKTVPANNLIGRITAGGGALRRFKVEVVSNIVGAGQSVFGGLYRDVFDGLFAR